LTLGKTDDWPLSTYLKGIIGFIWMHCSCAVLPVVGTRMAVPFLFFSDEMGRSLLPIPAL
jgi:hypothetical protein